ncbi:MAG: hypothetical protein KGZ82_04245 [Bacteroidales bacterium]|nr:hypothetical protein [Bacteroidales bacterium]
MKIKILQALKTRYANLGFGDKAFDGVADYLSKTVTEESQIETATAGVEPLLKAFQGDIDKVRTELSQKTKELEDLKKKPEPPKPEPDEPAWFKTWKEEQAKKIESLEKENHNFKAEKAKETRTVQVAAKVKELGIPEWRMKGVTVPETLDEAGVTTFLTEIKQELITAGLGGKTETGTLVQGDEALKQIAAGLVDKYSVSDSPVKKE